MGWFGGVNTHYFRKHPHIFKKVHQTPQTTKNHQAASSSGVFNRLRSWKNWKPSAWPFRRTPGFFPDKKKRVGFLVGCENFHGNFWLVTWVLNDGSTQMVWEFVYLVIKVPNHKVKAPLKRIPIETKPHAETTSLSRVKLKLKLKHYVKTMCLLQLVLSNPSPVTPPNNSIVQVPKE